MHDPVNGEHDKGSLSDQETVVRTLRQLAYWSDDDRTEDALLRLADTVERDDLDDGFCCPMSQEVECDAGCPLEFARVSVTVWPDVMRQACVSTVELVAQQIEHIYPMAHRDQVPAEAKAAAYKAAAAEARKIGERIRTGELVVDGS